MATLIKLAVLFSISVLLQNSYCKREKRGITDFFIPGINLGDIAVDTLKRFIFGAPIDKDQIIIDRQMEHMETTKQVLSLTQQIAVLAKNSPELTTLIQTLQKIPKHLKKIDTVFRLYEFYQKSKRKGTDYRIRQFAMQSSGYSGPIMDIHELYSLVLPASEEYRVLKNEDYSLLFLVTKYIKGYEKLCDKYRSEQIELLSILETMTIAELKVFLIMDFSIRKLSETEELDYESELDILRSELEDRFKELITGFRTYMSKASREVWRCDSQRYIEDETYFKMNIFQKYISRDIEMSPENPPTCQYSCDHFNNVKHYRCQGYKSRYGKKTSNSSCESVRDCAGKLYGCEDNFTKYPVFRTCPADTNSTRRYEFIEAGNYQVSNKTRYGLPVSDMPKCKEEFAYDRPTSVGLRYCETCLCTCDDSPSPNADQKVNIRVTTADKDHIVTGIRWLKKNHTLHIQIEQGKVLVNGKVNPATVNWKDIQEPRDERDIAFMSWEGLRGFLLQDVELKMPKDNVVAGVKLEVVESKNRKLITFRLLPLAYEYQTGELRYSKPFYEDPDSSLTQDLWDKAIEPSQLSNYSEYDLGTSNKIPMDTKESSSAVDDSNKYVLLTTSDFQTDVGQNTVPFFDMQRNVLSQPVPLSGVGIYLKKTNDYAFLALKLLTFDYVPHIAEKI